MADDDNAVALVLRRGKHRRRLLLHKPQHHQLAFHRLPLRLRRCLSGYNLDPPHWRPAPRNHRSIRSHPTRELDTLCWDTYITSQLRPHDVRASPYRSGTAFRPLGAHPVFRHLVHALWPRLRYRDRFPREPFRRRAGTTHQPLPSKRSI